MLKRFFTNLVILTTIFWCLGPSAVMARSCLNCSEIANSRTELSRHSDWCADSHDDIISSVGHLDPVRLQHGRASLQWQRVTRAILHKLAGDDTRAFLGFPVSISFSNSPKPFAHATSSSEMTISLGLLEIVEDSDELAFVVAHEIGHMALGHTSHRDNVPNALQGTKRNDIKDEVDADLFALSLMRSANFEAEAASHLLSKLGNYGAEYGVPLIDLYPSLSARIQQMQLRSSL